MHFTGLFLRVINDIFELWRHKPYWDCSLTPYRPMHMYEYIHLHRRAACWLVVVTCYTNAHVVFKWLMWMHIALLSFHLSGASNLLDFWWTICFMWWICMNIVVQGEYAIMPKKKGDSSISKSDLFSTPIPTAPTSHHLSIFPNHLHALIMFTVCQLKQIDIYSALQTNYVTTSNTWLGTIYDKLISNIFHLSEPVVKMWYESIFHTCHQTELTHWGRDKMAAVSQTTL